MARFKLRFGPYRMPRLKPSQRADCEYAGTVRVVAISDAPVQWPLGRVCGHRIPVLCGDLVRAVKTEAACDVAAAWGVSPYLVGQWRKALNVRRTIGTHQRQSEGIRAADPARARKIADAKLGKPRQRHVIEAMRRTHVGKPLPAATRAKMSSAHRRPGHAAAVGWPGMGGVGGQAVPEAASGGGCQADGPGAVDRLLAAGSTGRS